jgi:3-hydroxyisobutyrate dehydrogenase-like beta-hydroxyacid dehydrogenase
MTTGFLHPGAMGASMAAVCAGDRLWAGDGRSAATRVRAEAAGLVDVGTIEVLASQVDVLVSICPPAAALDVADSVAVAEFDGLYVDANAVSPATARSVSERFARFVDGSVVGAPVREGGGTRLYVAGTEAASVAALWRGSPLDVVVIDGDAGAASALKVCYAAWTKGTAAFLLAIRALARAEGVEGPLLDAWSSSNPDLIRRSEAAAAGNASKAWRFVGEMHENADAFAAHDLPDGFLRAAADVYERMSPLQDESGADLDAVLATLLRESPGP